MVTTIDGRRVSKSQRQVREATIATRAEGSTSPDVRSLLFDSCFGSLNICVALANKGFASSVVHIKSAHNVFPKLAPGGSHLEESINDGIQFIMQFIYNAKNIILTCYVLRTARLTELVSEEMLMNALEQRRLQVAVLIYLQSVCAPRHTTSIVPPDLTLHAPSLGLRCIAKACK